MRLDFNTAPGVSNDTNPTVPHGKFTNTASKTDRGALCGNVIRESTSPQFGIQNKTRPQKIRHSTFDNDGELDTGTQQAKARRTYIIVGFNLVDRSLR
jgi:hypothetical protein